MTRLYNPDIGEVVEAEGRAVKVFKEAGYIVVGNRPEAEYRGRTRAEILADD